MNVANILKVAEAIEQSIIPDLGFNMKSYRHPASPQYPDMGSHSCGTVACIAGWAMMVEGKKIGGLESFHRAREVLNITEAHAFELFVPGWEHNPISAAITAVNYADNSISPEVAVRCLRNLAITGKVSWEDAMKDDNPSLPAVPVKKGVDEPLEA